MSVRRALRALCTAWGIPRRVYVDRGPGYQAGRFHFGCSELGIDLCQSKPYVSEGRGVIERFSRTVKEAFEIEVRLRPEPPTLDELNAFWRPGSMSVTSAASTPRPVSLRSSDGSDC